MLGAAAQPLSPQCLLFISELLIGQSLELNKWKREALEGPRCLRSSNLSGPPKR